jgi:hypothetical protein
MDIEPYTFTTARRTAVALLAAVSLAAASAPAALADEGHGTQPAGQTAAEHGRSADEHAQMSADEHDMSAEEHAAHGAAEPAATAEPKQTPATDEHGTSAVEHGQMSADKHAAHGGSETGGTARAGSDATVPGHDEHASGGHGAEAPAGDRPAGLVLAGFGLLNALVLAYAAVIRRRPDALKRRQTLQRVRSTPPKQTVFPSSSSAEKLS